MQKEQSEWVEVRDSNGRLLLEMSVLTGRVRVRVRGLTTEVDLEAVREQHLRRLWPSSDGASEVPILRATLDARERGL